MKDEVVALTGNTISWALTASQTKVVFEIVQIIVATIVSLLTAAYIVWKWYKKAKSDGKITADEVAELANDIKDEFQEKGGKDND